jgi:hypothetical protein
MTNDELDQLLKSAAVPLRDSASEETFPQRVTQSLRKTPAPTESSPVTFKLNFLIWGTGLATACLAVGFLIGFRNGVSRGKDPELADAQKYFRELQSLFPNQVRAIIFEKDAPRLLLSETPDVPASSPLFLKICSEKDCRSLVTFSGQRFQLDGEMFEILSDRQGHILLVGKNSVWSSNDPAPTKHRSIQGQPLEM